MKARGFTIIELLVVVSILTLLIALLMPALSRVREQARLSICAADARTMVNFFQAYAQDNDGLFPDLHDKGSGSTDGQLYWLGGPWRERMRDEFNLPRNVLYSPSNTQWNRDDFYWYGDPVGQSVNSSCVVGHFYFGAPLAGTSSVVGSLVNYSTASGGKIFPRRNTDVTKTTFLWGDLNRKLGDGNWVTTGDPNRVGSNHLNRAINNPDGSHMGHADGHVEWTDGPNVIFQMKLGGTDYYW